MVQTNTTNLNNELYPSRFKLVFSEIKSTELLCTSANIPGVNGTGVEVPNQTNKIFVPGKKLDYDTFNVTFKVDRDLTNYREIYAWILGIYSPQDLTQFKSFQENVRVPIAQRQHKYGYDASLLTLKNSFNVNFEIRFSNLFPMSLSSIDFNLVDDTTPVTATATFRYDYYNFV